MIASAIETAEDVGRPLRSRIDRQEHEERHGLAAEPQEAFVEQREGAEAYIKPAASEIRSLASLFAIR